MFGIRYPDISRQSAGRDCADIDFSVRETAAAVFVLAAKREGATAEVRFRGLPVESDAGDVLFEEPRKVALSHGGFTDWFGPNEVHVYRFAKPGR